MQHVQVCAEREHCCMCWTPEIDVVTETLAWARGELGSLTRYSVHLICSVEATRVTVVW